MNLLDSLNKEQRSAVVDTEGPVLVLAGAGSGKTRVLTHKVAYLLQQNLARPWEVMAVTFTNKAAAEMKSRIEKLLNSDLGQMWVGTFHSLFARIMRRFGDKMGYSSNFAIYDREDQERIMKEILAEHPLWASSLNPRKAVGIISSIKSKLRTPQDSYRQMEIGVSRQELFETYERKLKTYNALDFDDLLVKPLELMQKFPNIADLHRERFRYILVDEFQDTNIAQNELLKVLWSKHRNLTVVGDDDQAIYGWRGAEIGNILNFAHDYHGAKIYRLEKNYRSTNLILQVAQSVIENNRSRHGKNLWTEIQSSVKPVLIAAYDDRDEALKIASLIRQLCDNNFRRSQIAILYRINAQSRSLENALREFNIPYNIIGGLKFYQRKEIKDLLAYLKLIINPADGISLMRIINFPPRGIGDKTISRIVEYAGLQNLKIWDALVNADKIPEFRAGTVKKLNDFASLISSLRDILSSTSIEILVKTILNKSGMVEYYLNEGDEESRSRIDNLNEFVAGVEDYIKAHPENRLEDFLQEVALVSETDEWQEGEMINLMTLHTAKGLEFPVIFITGLEDGLFPLMRDENCDLEEERRLFYVGITRTMQRLYFSYAQRRRDNFYSSPSRFVLEIPITMLEPYSASASYISEAHSGIHTSLRISQEPVSQFRRGDAVSHPTFGEGIVSTSDIRDGEEIITVFFQGYGAKKIKARFVRKKNY